MFSRIVPPVRRSGEVELSDVNVRHLQHNLVLSGLGMYKRLCRLIKLIHSYKFISSGRLISRKYRLQTSINTCEKDDSDFVTNNNNDNNN